MPRSATARDVAKLAGVSQATVSLVLNDNPGSRFSDATRRRVEQAAAELGYLPSRAARALRLGRSDSIVLLSPDTPAGANGVIVVSTLMDKVAALGFELVLRRLRPGEPMAALWEPPIPAAVIGTEIPTEPDLAAMRAAGVAPLFVDMEAVNVRIGALQARHLLERGHRTLGYAGPADARSASFVRARAVGAADQCRAGGCADLVVVDCDVDPGAASRAVARLRAAAVTGVVAYNDDHAFAVLYGARMLGLRVPDDLAVIGVDDLAIGRVAGPPLSTVQVQENGLVEAVTGLRAGRLDTTIEVALSVVHRSSS